VATGSGQELGEAREAPAPEAQSGVQCRINLDSGLLASSSKGTHFSCFKPNPVALLEAAGSLAHMLGTCSLTVISGSVHRGPTVRQAPHLPEPQPKPGT
jgi:hypothetical protein